MKFNLLMFTVYTIVFELLVWLGFGWVVFIDGNSGWWMLLALFMSGAQLKPKHFGLDFPINSDQP